MRCRFPRLTLSRKPAFSCSRSDSAVLSGDVPGGGDSALPLPAGDEAAAPPLEAEPALGRRAIVCCCCCAPPLLPPPPMLLERGRRLRPPPSGIGRLPRLESRHARGSSEVACGWGGYHEQAKLGKACGQWNKTNL
eukprot:356777-Chlamydomonas_euryale.AAC.6